MCGDLVYSATYDGIAVGPTDQPFAYSDPATNEITINTDDDNLIGLSKPYTITAKFVNYPDGQSESDSDLVNYISPCLDPTYTTISVVPQVNSPMTINSFDGIATPFTYTPYTVDPAFCEPLLTYTYDSTESPS